MADDFSTIQAQENSEMLQPMTADMKQGERTRLQPIMEQIETPDVGRQMQAGAAAAQRGVQQYDIEAQSQYEMRLREARQRVQMAQDASEGETSQQIADREFLANHLAMPYRIVASAQADAHKEYIVRKLSDNEWMAQWAGANEKNATYARDYLDTVVDFFKDLPNWKEWGDSLMHWLVFDSGKAVERFGYNLTEGAAQANKAFVDFGRMFVENIGMEPAAKYLEGVSKNLDRYRNLAEQFGVGRPKEEKAGALWDEFVKSVPQQAWNLLSLALFKRPMPGTLAVGAGEVAGARAAAAVNPLLAKAGEGLAGTSIMGAQIAGGSYGELREQGVSPEIAGIAAAGNALMQAPFEKIGFEKFVDVFRAKGMKEAMIKALSSIFAEGTTEWIQKWPEYLAHTWAKSEGHGNNVFDRANWFFGQLFDPENLRQANDEAMLEAAVGAMWGGLGGGVRIAMTHSMQQKAREQADFLLGVRQITQMAIDKGMPPEVVKTMLEAKQPLMASTGYVDAEAALTLYQEGNAAVLDALGVTEEELTQLADEGGAVPIQLSDLETRVDQATFDQLYQHVSIRPGSYTAAEGAQPMDANAYTRSALAEARRKANQIPGVSAELSRMYHELLDSGVSRQQARDNTTLLAVQAATLQAKGFDALSWLKRRKYVVGEDGQTYTVPVGLPQTENAELVSEDLRSQIASSTDSEWLSKLYFGNQQMLDTYAKGTELRGADAQERDRLQAVNAMVTARLAMLNHPLSQSAGAKALDAEYMAAVNAGDMETAQRMVNERAALMGYSPESDYRMQHRAPDSSYPDEIPNLREVAEGSDMVPDDFFTHPEYYIDRHDPADRESLAAIKAAIADLKNGGDGEMTMYRAVPSDVKEGSFRNAAWITPSRRYAEMHRDHALNGKGRIIEMRVKADDVWWDANSINEWGYDDRKKYAYRNTKNNRKVLDAVTYDDDGNVIPLSKRFSYRNPSVLYQAASVSEQSMEAVRQQYAGTEQWMKAPNGQPTKLTERQWLYVRTPEFKDKFGDWEHLADLDAAKNFVLSGENVATLTGNEFQKKEGESLIDRVSDYFKSIGGVAVSPSLGRVELNRHGAKSSIAHGVGSLKASAFAAVKNVIENGVVFDRRENWKGRKYNTVVIAAPVKIASQSYVCEVIVVQKKTSNEYYLHEVNLRSLLSATVKTPAGGASSGEPARPVRSILAKLLSEVNDSGLREKLDENGEPKAEFVSSVVTLNQDAVDLVNELFQRVWHGSPFKFDRFTLEHIGEGEGAQVHGWGLYFALSRAIADERYRKRLLGRNAALFNFSTKNGSVSEEANKFLNEKLNFTRVEELRNGNTTEFADAMHGLLEYNKSLISGFEDRINAIEGVISEIETNDKLSISALQKQTKGLDVDFDVKDAVKAAKAAAKNEGRKATTKDVATFIARNLNYFKTQKEEAESAINALSSVDFNTLSAKENEGQLYEVEIPDNDVLLDENLQGFLQPPAVRQAIEALHEETGDDFISLNATGKTIYDRLASRLGSPKAASMALKEKGVLGITYEGATDGRCFVIWDDESIQVYNTLYEAKKSATQSNPRGSYTRTVQGEDLIRIFQGHDASTVPHESAHAYHQLLEDMAADDGTVARQSCIDALVQTGMIPAVAAQYANIPVEEMGQVIAELQAQVVHFDESMNVEGADKEAIANDKKTILAQIDAITQLQRHHVAVEQARQDLKTIREWAGVPVEGTLTREQYIQVQEQFARGFEGYLATGKAPTTALAGVFARFKQWLLAIYKNIRDYVGADITPEIKDVYDRMLATEEEMQADEVAQTMLGEMPDAIAMLGCNASDYAFLEDLLTRAHMAASSRVDKERAKDRRKRYKAAYEMALTSLMEQPLWRLATGGYGRINYESLQEYLNKQEANELRKRLPKVIVSGDGSSLDVIAMGFDDEMLSREFGGNADDIAQMLYEHIVLNGEKLQDEAKALANQALESQDAEYTVEDGLLAGDEYGDFLDALEDEAAKMQRRASAKGKKKAEAREAAAEQKAEEAQAEAEAKAKAKAEREAKLAGVRAERKALWAEYQRRAKDELDATPVGQIDPKRYAAMLRKALKGKDNAILSRDPDKAVEAVRKARYAYALMRESKRRRDMVERNLSMVEKLCRRKPGDIAPVPATALARLLQTYGFRVPKRWGGDPAHENDSMQALASACIAEAQGEETVEVTPDLAEWVMQEAVPDYAQDSSWQSLTWADYNDLMDVFNFFVHASKEQNQNNKDSMKARVEFCVEQGVQSMQGMETLTSAPKGSWRRAWQNVSRRIFGAVQALQWQFRKADGFKNAGPKGKAGALESLVMRPILEGENEFRARMKELSRLLAEPLERLRQTGLRLQTEYGNKNGELIKLNAKLPEALSLSEGRSSWTTDQVIALALNCGNEGNRQRITGGYPDLGYDTLAAIVGSDLAAQICQDNAVEVPEDAVYQSGIFTADDWAAVQQIWDAIETLWEPTVKVHRSMYGFAPRRVDVTPMTFRAQGVEVALKGGYYPIYYDKDISLEAQQWGERDDIMSTTESFFPAPSAKRGHTKSRQKKTKHPLRLSTSTLMDHVQDALKLICFGEAVRFADRVTKHPVFAVEYTRIFGQEDYKALRPNLKGVVRSEPAPKDAMIRLANATRKYLVSAGLWGNLKVAILQTTALGPAMGDLGAVPVWQAMGRIATGGWGLIREIQQASPYMMSRWRAFDQDLLDKAQSLDINKRPRTVKIGNKEISWDDIVNAGMTPLCLVDLVTSGAIWQAAYSKFMKSKGLPGSLNQGAQFHAEAVQYADEEVKKSNPDFDASSRSAFLRAQNSYRLFNAFGSAVTLMAQRGEYMWEAMKHKRITKAQYARWEAYEMLAPAVAMTLIMALARGIVGGGDDDGEKLAALFFESLLDQYSMKVPFFGSIIEGTIESAAGISNSGRQPTMRTVVDTPINLFYRLPTAAVKAWDGDDEAKKKLSYAIGDIVSFILRVPASKLVRNAERGYDQWERGEGTPASMLMPAPGK